MKTTVETAIEVPYDSKLMKYKWTIDLANPDLESLIIIKSDIRKTVRIKVEHKKEVEQTNGVDGIIYCKNAI